MHPFLPQHSTFGRCQKHSKTEKLFQKLVLMIRGSKTQASIFAMLERLPQGQQWSGHSKGLRWVEGSVVVEGDRGHSTLTLAQI